MSSAAIIDTLNFATGQLYIYCGLFIVITGIFGQICNIIVFTTLKTFRETTCGFYLTIVSVVNTGQLVTVLLRVLTFLNITMSNARIYCKFSIFLTQYCALVSLTSMCLTTIDQFLSMTKYRHLNNMRLAHRHIAFTCILWLIHGIFTLIYCDSYQNACIITNIIFAKYFSYIYGLILLGFLPLTVMSTFSLLAFIKIRTAASRQINRVRLCRDRQLTAMTLLHVLLIVITGLPLVIVFTCTLNYNAADPQEFALNRLILAISGLLSFAGCACPFYIYNCVSKRFRKQVVYVLIGIHWNRCQRRVNNLNNNQVLPGVVVESINEQQEADIRSSNDIALY